MSEKIDANVFFLGPPEHPGKGGKKVIYAKFNTKTTILIWIFKKNTSLRMLE
jgi:hypothetical protein